MKKKGIALAIISLCILLTSCTDEPVVVNNYYITNSDGSVSQVDSVPEGYIEVSSIPEISSTNEVSSVASVSNEFGVDKNLKLNTTYYVTGTNNYLALRTAPYYDGSNEIGKLSNGDTVEVKSQTIYGDKGEYCYVTATSSNVNGKSGYVNRNYISLKNEKTVSSAASSKANKTASSSSSKKTQISSKAQASKKAESVSLTIVTGSDYNTYAVVEGRNSNGDVVWDYTTEARPGAQLPCARELGQRDGVYYFADESTLVALDVQSGSVVWKQDMGVSVGASLLADDAIYVCGALQSKLCIIDYDGNTILKAKTISSEYYWPSDIQVSGDIIAITMTGASTGHKLPKTLYVDKSGNLIEDSSKSDTSAATDVSNIFDVIPSEFTFSSGAGGWRTLININSDGSFTGNYVDYDLGDTGADYPKGSAAICDFTGKFTNVTKIDDFTYSMKVISLVQEGTRGDEYIEDGTRFTVSHPYGFDDADEFMLYLPGKPISELSSDFLSWVQFGRRGEQAIPDGTYGLYNVNGKEGFTGIK